MSAGALLPVFRWQLFNGATPVSGALLYSYVSGSATALPLYSDYLLTVPLSNPVVADSNGVFPTMYMLAQAYRITVTDANGVTIYTPQDHIYDLWQLQAVTTQTANLVYAGPASGAAAAPTFRALVVADFPAGVGPWTDVTTVATGSQNDFAPGIVGNTIVRCNNASDLILTGLSSTGIATGTFVLLEAIGAGNLYSVPQSASSLAGNRFINAATIGNTGASAGAGRFLYRFDGTTQRWRLILHQQGDFLDYSTVSTIVGWTSFTTKRLSYFLTGRKLDIQWYISGTSNATGVTFTVPYTSTSVGVPGGPGNGSAGISVDNGALLTSPSSVSIGDASAIVTIAISYSGSASGWTNSGTKTTAGNLTVDVQ